MPRYKHTAVERNLLKRRLREIARTRLVPVLPPGDVVIKALPHAYGAPFDALGRQLERVVDRIAQATREPRRTVPQVPATPQTDAPPAAPQEP